MLRNNAGTLAFADALSRLVASAPAMLHLDISGMYIGDEGIKRIMVEGVAESKTLAAIHFADNQVNHWTRVQIYYALNAKSVANQKGAVEN